jgi:hypothetical protein
VNTDLTRILDGLPWALPVTVLAVVAAALLAAPVGRRLGVGTLAAWALLASIGAIAAITLTPSADVPDVSGCDLTVTPLSLDALLSFNDRSLNVALFVPLGIVLGAVRLPHRWAWLLGAFAAPIAIELVQLAAASLWRTCQAIDVLDNWTGLVLGLAIGEVAGWAWRRRRDAA